MIQYVICWDEKVINFWMHYLPPKKKEMQNPECLAILPTCKHSNECDWVDPEPVQSTSSWASEKVVMQCHAACTLHTQLAVPCSTGIGKALQGFLQLMHRDSLYSLLILNTELTKTHVKTAENHTKLHLKAQMPAQHAHGLMVFVNSLGPWSLRSLLHTPRHPKWPPAATSSHPTHTSQHNNSHLHTVVVCYTETGKSYGAEVPTHPSRAKNIEIRHVCQGKCQHTSLWRNAWLHDSWFLIQSS